MYLTLHLTNFVHVLLLLFKYWHVVLQFYESKYPFKSHGFTKYNNNISCFVLLQSNAEFRAMGERLKQLFDQEFKKAFNIHA